VTVDGAEHLAATLTVDDERIGDLPMALTALHRALPVGGLLDVTFDVVRTVAGVDDTRATLRDLLVGAGFVVEELVAVLADDDDGTLRVAARAVRQWTLPDTVGPGMRLLVCGLNPSLYAADAGVGFARPGNRFWPAALAAGLVSVDRDPDAALRDHGMGMTDLVKRATVAASELAVDEYREGYARVERLVRRFRPGAICFVGLAGWRAAVDRRAVAGVQPGDIAGTPVYVMPSTSGLNAGSRLADLTEHLRQAAALPG
jgi:double-stranded uracil-DNA glycosylase